MYPPRMFVAPMNNQFGSGDRRYQNVVGIISLFRRLSLGSYFIVSHSSGRGHVAVCLALDSIKAFDSWRNCPGDQRRRLLP